MLSNLLIAGVDKALPIDEPLYLKGWYSKGLLGLSEGLKNKFSFPKVSFKYKKTHHS